MNIVDGVIAGQLWVAMLIQDQVAAETPGECALCGGLLGAAMFPGMTGTVSQDTVIDTIAAHQHYRWVDVELFRLPAHSEPVDRGVRVVPDVDRDFTALQSGFYRLAVYDHLDRLLVTVDLGSLMPGATVPSMGVAMTLCGDNPHTRGRH